MFRRKLAVTVYHIQCSISFLATMIENLGPELITTLRYKILLIH